MKKILFLGLTLLPVSFVCGKYMPDWESIDSRPTPEWFQNAKFGIFIHWGLYSVPAWGPTETESIYDKYAEWYWYKLKDETSPVNEQFVEFHKKNYGKDAWYQDFASQFKAELFRPKDWAKLFKQAGAQYVVLTSKHHEGYCLWPSEQSWNWNVMDVGPHRDLAGDLSDAVKAEGLHMGFYYSLYEWFNPQFLNDVNRYVDQHMLPQMKDLVQRYEPDIVWTDGEWDHPSDTWRSTEFLAWLYNESPVKDSVVVNDRWGNETRGKHGGIYTTEYNLVHDEEVTGGMDHPWEECRGIGTSFGYNRNEDLNNYSSSTELIHLLVDKVSKGGNLLLNVGPTADGRIPVIMQQRLSDVGDWLKINGEAIYGTRKWDRAIVAGDSPVSFTRKGNDLYLFNTDPHQTEVFVSGVNPESVEILGSSVKVDWVVIERTVRITIPKLSLDQLPCSYAWVFKLRQAF